MRRLRNRIIIFSIMRRRGHLNDQASDVSAGPAKPHHAPAEPLRTESSESESMFVVCASAGS
jgi:hypothetical protein